MAKWCCGRSHRHRIFTNWSFGGSYTYLRWANSNDGPRRVVVTGSMAGLPRCFCGHTLTKVAVVTLEVRGCFIKHRNPSDQCCMSTTKACSVSDSPPKMSGQNPGMDLGGSLIGSLPFSADATVYALALVCRARSSFSSSFVFFPPPASKYAVAACFSATSSS